jgi:hypothetical protein
MKKMNVLKVELGGEIYETSLYLTGNNNNIPKHSLPEQVSRYSKRCRVQINTIWSTCQNVCLKAIIFVVKYGTCIRAYK